MDFQNILTNNCQNIPLLVKIKIKMTLYILTCMYVSIRSVTYLYLSPQNVFSTKDVEKNEEHFMYIILIL